MRSKMPSLIEYKPHRWTQERPKSAPRVSKRCLDRSKCPGERPVKHNRVSLVLCGPGVIRAKKALLALRFKGKTEHHEKERSAKEAPTDVIQATQGREAKKNLSQVRAICSHDVIEASEGCPEGSRQQKAPAARSRSGATLAVVWSKRGHGTAAGEAYAVEGAQQ